MHVLALNSGSSSLKFGLYRSDGSALACIWRGEASGVGSDRGALSIAPGRDGKAWHQDTALADAAAALQRIRALLAERGAPLPQAIGQRIVHGGPGLREHRLIDAALLAQLEAAVGLAPLHLPAALALIRDAAAHFPGLPQVACLDTCFHAQMPALARTLALPQAVRDAGVERVGFHGLSCESIVQQLGGALPARLVIAHLGQGASITAVRDGVSVDTSMGLTPTGGLPMGSRSGDLDPGVTIHLMRLQPMDATALESLLSQRSGLLGISNLSGDMRLLQQAAAQHGGARLAIDIFCMAVAKTVAAMGIVLGGIDALVFTGGIGENDAALRAQVCTLLAPLGIALDAQRNLQGAQNIGSASSRAAVQVLQSREDEQIARHTQALCGLSLSST